MPKTNSSFWQQKIRRNQERDGEVDKALHRLGWKAVRVWEHEITKSTDGVADKLLKLTSRRKINSQRRGNKRPILKIPSRRSVTVYER
jgi:DNA mismatch endonuclease (patch repair protein)